MARYRRSKLRITRRLGTLPGLTSKISKNNTIRPGQHGRSNENTGKKLTEYGIRLEEKQKLKFNYGLSESQLFSYIKKARKRKGVTGLILLQLLEMRLDTICYNLGFASTIAQARQLVNHGHILVNNKSMNIPSFQCAINDVISIKNKISSKNLIESRLKSNRIAQTLPAHLKLEDNQKAIVLDYCDRNDVGVEVKELLVVEYYSRK